VCHLKVSLIYITPLGYNIERHFFMEKRNSKLDYDKMIKEGIVSDKGKDYAFLI